jgi:hypothetical protein
MEKARRACEALFLDEGLPQIIVEITSSNFNIYTLPDDAARLVGDRGVYSVHPVGSCQSDLDWQDPTGRKEGLEARAPCSVTVARSAIVLPRRNAPLSRLCSMHSLRSSWTVFRLPARLWSLSYCLPPSRLLFGRRAQRCRGDNRRVRPSSC